MTRLLIYAPSYPAVAAEIDARAPDLDILIMDDTGVITLQGHAVAPSDANPDIVWFSEALYMAPAARAFAGAVIAAPNLRWVQSAAAGFESPFFSAIVAKGAHLTTSHGQAVGIADFVVAGVLDVFQRGPERRAAQAAGQWRELQTREVLDSTWLIIGFGAIGQAVAARAGGFGARVIGVRRDQTAHPLAEAILPMEAMRSILPSADVVALCSPLNPSTRRMADAGFFAAMKPGSVLVNIGRGGLVDEAALLASLERGVPRHAVLDVFDTEPLASDSLFWRHPRVSVTAHCSGVTGGQTARNAGLFLDNLSRFVAGEPLLNLADPKDVLGG